MAEQTSRGRLRRGWLAAALVAAAAPSGAAESPVRLSGEIWGDRDLSAVTRLGSHLAVASDETAGIQLLEAEPDGAGWRVAHGVALAAPGEEIDLEALAADGGRLWAVGSHSLNRRKVSPHRSRRANWRRLATAVHDPSRDALYRLEIDPQTGRPSGRPARLDLRPLLASDELLGPFSRVPGKENGIDIEGLAVRDGQVWLGFRSPVLRQGHVPVLVLRFDEPERYELRLLQLVGRGIRALETVDEGLLVLVAREVDPAPRVLFWDGHDGVPGRDAARPRLIDLGPVPKLEGASPEGLALVASDDDEFRVLVIYDGVRGGAPCLLRLPRPARTTRPAPRPG